jgi:hypothetical protein
MSKPDRQDDPDISLTAMVVVVGTVLTFVVVVFLQAVFYRAETAEYERKIVNEPPKKLRSVRAEQGAVLNDYRWVDRENGVVAIPIERAMEIMIERGESSTTEEGD